MNDPMFTYLDMLYEGKVSFLEIPEDVRKQESFIARIERYNSIKKHTTKISLIGRRGYDVIHNDFFVEKYVSTGGPKIEHLDSFSDYFEKVAGDIYTASCYYQYVFSDEIVDKYNLELQRITDDGVTKKRWEKDSRRLRKEDRARIRKKYVVSDGTFKIEIKDEDSHTFRAVLYEEFEFFFDFVAYLDGDLSNADLLLCEGISNLTDIKGLKFDGTLLPTPARRKLGLASGSPKIELAEPKEFQVTVKNEEQSQLVLKSQREESDYGQTNLRICYISDLHLDHQLINAGCETENDAKYYIAKETLKIANELKKYGAKFLIIAGDIASDFRVYKWFIHYLSEAMSSVSIYSLDVIVILGNHELWAFPNLKPGEIANKYCALVESDYRMHFMYNEVLYVDMKNHWRFSSFSSEQLLTMSEDDIASKLAMSQITFLGGIGFSGRNPFFNADNGIYRSVLTRSEEIEQSEKMSKLHEIVCRATHGRNLVVCTHCPARDWTEEKNILPGAFYISGHTHKNTYIDNDEYHIFEDNQIGYHSDHENHLKYFDTAGTIDIFEEWEDGIYQITPEQYVDFNCGKQIRVKCNRQHKAIHMLKKLGYYMFVMESSSGNLCIMNGGSIKKLPYNDLEFLYFKMDSIITKLKSPLDVFTRMQSKVASAVRKIGGSGRIHGCIVDIDYFNHIYVNPIDATIHGYYATSIYNKHVYDSIPALLNQRCPDMYAEYNRLLMGHENEADNALIVLKGISDDVEKKPLPYYSLDMYAYSRQIKKIQKLNSNILTEWGELDKSTALPEKI